MFGLSSRSSNWSSIVTSWIVWGFMGFSLICSSSCTAPVLDGEVREITAVELAAQYRDDPVGANEAFTGQTVQVLVRNFSAEKNEIIWKVMYTGKEVPPTIIFRFDTAEKVKAPCWIEGKCRGMEQDGKWRGVAGYTFTVLVTGCRVVSRSTPTEP